MAGRGNGRRDFGDRVGSAIQEVPPWESGVVPKGLTLEELQGVAPKKMAGLAKSTGQNLRLSVGVFRAVVQTPRSRACGSGDGAPEGVPG